MVITRFPKLRIILLNRREDDSLVIIGVKVGDDDVKYPSAMCRAGNMVDKVREAITDPIYREVIDVTANDDSSTRVDCSEPIYIELEVI